MFDIGTLPPEFLFSHQSVPKSRLATASPREKRFGCSRTGHLFVHRGGHTRENCEEPKATWQSPAGSRQFALLWQEIATACGLAMTEVIFGGYFCCYPGKYSTWSAGACHPPYREL